MKNDQCIDLIENILRANYIPVYRFTLPCTNLEQLDLGLRSYLLGIHNTVVLCCLKKFKMNVLKKSSKT